MYDCVKEEELGYVKVSDEWMLKVVGEMLQEGQ